MTSRTRTTLRMPTAPRAHNIIMLCILNTPYSISADTYLAKSQGFFFQINLSTSLYTSVISLNKC